MNFINFLYVLLLLISLYLLVNTPYTIYNNLYIKGWIAKVIIFYLTTFIYILSIFITNKYINKYILPLLIFLNIAILIVITFYHKINILNLLALTGIIYILYIFDYKDFELKNGLLIKPNKVWIYLHICSLIIYYLLSRYISIYSKIGFILLICYPLLFPINEYVKHRVISLFIAILIRNYLFYKKIIKFR